MKEFRVKVLLRNNRLVQRREELGMSQAKFARAVGLTQSLVCALETMRDLPMNPKGAWKPAALRIAEFHGVPPEDLWPDVVLAVRRSTAVVLASGPELAAFVNPEEALSARETSWFLTQAFDRLTAREQLVLTKTAEGATLTSIGQELGCSRENVRRIGIEAAAKLRRVADGRAEEDEYLKPYPRLAPEGQGPEGDVIS